MDTSSEMAGFGCPPRRRSREWSNREVRAETGTNATQEGHSAALNNRDDLLPNASRTGRFDTRPTRRLHSVPQPSAESRCRCRLSLQPGVFGGAHCRGHRTFLGRLCPTVTRDRESIGGTEIQGWRQGSASSQSGLRRSDSRWSAVPARRFLLSGLLQRPRARHALRRQRA